MHIDVREVFPLQQHRLGGVWWPRCELRRLVGQDVVIGLHAGVHLRRDMRGNFGALEPSVYVTYKKTENF